MARLSVRILVLLLALLAPFPSVAQVLPADTLRPPNTDPVDVRVFRAVYGVKQPAFVTTMRGVEEASKPIFYAVVPVVAGATLVAGGDWDPVARLAATELGAVGATFALKNLIRRPRPYAGLEGVEARGGSGLTDEFDPFSFPSGHASTAFALATSASFSHPEWYVIAPAYAWASATAIARVWHAAHYPLDILVGAALGAGTAVLVHVFLPEIDPELDDEERAPAVVSLRFAF